MTTEKQNWLERPIHPALPGITNEIILFGAIILMTFVTRFYDLGTRVMSHDESLHTYFSWLFYRGQGYQHSPMMHGPLQFHLLALTYFLFGVSDFTARIPAVYRQDRRYHRRVPDGHISLYVVLRALRSQ